MTTWEEIRDEVAGMLADGKPLEEVIGKLEKQKDEMAKPMTNEEYIKSLNTEQLAEFLNLIIRVGPYENEPKDFWEHVYGRGGEYGAKSIVDWLKQPHTPKE